MRRFDQSPGRKGRITEPRRNLQGRRRRAVGGGQVQELRAVEDARLATAHRGGDLRARGTERGEHLVVEGRDQHLVGHCGALNQRAKPVRERRIRKLDLHVHPRRGELLEYLHQRRHADSLAAKRIALPAVLRPAVAGVELL